MATKSITSGQQREIRGFVEEVVDDVMRKLGIDRESAQTLVGNAGAFKERLHDPIAAAMREFLFANQFANEVVSSNCAYPREYTGPKAIRQQVDILAKAFDLSLGATVEFIEKVLPGIALPKGAEGWFAIPSIEAVAKRHFPETTDSAERNCRAVEMIIEKLSATRMVHNYRQGELTTRYLRQHSRTAEFFSRIAQQQKGDILIVSAQFGMNHRGESVRCAREFFRANEFGLGAFAVGCMTFAHPERFVRLEQLHTDCTGDEYDFGAERQWFGAPVWHFGDGLDFGTSLVNLPGERCGSVSAFLPE